MAFSCEVLDDKLTTNRLNNNNDDKNGNNNYNTLCCALECDGFHMEQREAHVIPSIPVCV